VCCYGCGSRLENSCEADAPVDLAYIDPPYGDADQYAKVLEAVAKSPVFHAKSRNCCGAQTVV